MYCRNCGNSLPNPAANCPTCGVTVGTGTGYCSNCASPTDSTSSFCPHCGVSFQYGAPQGQPQPGVGYQPNYQAPPPPLGYAQKSKVAAGLLGIFLGSLGIHNFYLGFTNKAVIQLVLGILSCGAISGIWGLVEGILILTGSINQDASGMPLRD